MNVRNARFSDIKQLVQIYIDLKGADKRWFHPFPFNKPVLGTILFLMICMAKIIPLTKILYPKSIFLILVAENSVSGQISGFVYLRVKAKNEYGLVANRGILTVDNTKSKGIGTRMDNMLISIAKEIGVYKFRVSVLTENLASISFHKKMGYRVVGTAVEYWKGIEESVAILEYVIDHH